MFRLAAIVVALSAVGCTSVSPDDRVVLLEARPPARSTWLTTFQCEKDRVEILQGISIRRGEPKTSLIIKLNGRKLSGAEGLLLELQQLSGDEQEAYLFNVIGCPTGGDGQRMILSISDGRANWYLWLYPDEGRLAFLGDGSRFEIE